MTTDTTSLKDLKLKLMNALRRESTIYFKIEKLSREGKCSSILEEKAKSIGEEIAYLQNEIKKLEDGKEDMV